MRRTDWPIVAVIAIAALVVFVYMLVTGGFQEAWEWIRANGFP